MAKLARSWIKPDGIVNLIGRKYVDWSIFEYGTHIPIEFHQDFEQANSGFHLERGKSMDLKLIIEGQEFEAKLVNVNRKALSIDTLQIRYDGNRQLKDFLRDKLSKSYTYLSAGRNNKSDNDNSFIKVPEDMAEYIDFYQTDEPFRYNLKIITSEGTIGNKIQEVNKIEEGQEDYNKLALPFSEIFSDRGEASWAFELMATTAKILGIKSPNDERLVLGVRRNGKALHMNFANWLILGFYGQELGSKKVFVPLFVEDANIGDEFIDFRFKVQRKNEKEICGYSLPMEMIRPLKGDIEEVFKATMSHISKRFESYSKSPQIRKNNKTLCEAIFDGKVREELFSEGLVVEQEEQDYLESKEIILNPSYTLEDLSTSSGIEQIELERWIRAIKRKGQAILYGPPGIGKTYVAERLAKYFISESDGFYDLVQFHPAYAYEDFIQGIRPRSNPQGGLSYPVVPGRFLDFCKKARGRNGDCILIIDEINRANLSRVFGELMYLLEYRDQEIPLASGGVFSIPENVYVIGTMNTADRSIALVDHALRRRFALLSLQPNFEVLRKYHEQTGFYVNGLLDILKELNMQINDKNYEVGISFFLKNDLEEQLEDIWVMEIEPYLEEYFFDQPDRVNGFKWEKIKDKVIR